MSSQRLLLTKVTLGDSLTEKGEFEMGLEEEICFNVHQQRGRARKMQEDKVRSVQ